MRPLIRNTFLKFILSLLHNFHFISFTVPKSNNLFEISHVNNIITWIIILCNWRFAKLSSQPVVVDILKLHWPHDDVSLQVTLSMQCSKHQDSDTRVEFHFYAWFYGQGGTRHDCEIRSDDVGSTRSGNESIKKICVTQIRIKIIFFSKNSYRF